MDFENDFIMPRNKTHFYQEYTTSDNHKSIIHQYDNHKDKCWFIKGKITLEPNERNVQYICGMIESCGEQFFKKNANRHIVEIEYSKDLKSAKYYNYKETKISYLICFLKKGTLEEMFELTKPLIMDIDSNIQNIICSGCD